jgi:hypothetical protein
MRCVTVEVDYIDSNVENNREEILSKQWLTWGIRFFLLLWQSILRPQQI